MKFELLNILGKDITSPEVQDVIERWKLTDVEDSPPSRCYYGSKHDGLDLLTDRGQVIDIQIFVQPAQGHSRFSGALPFAILAGMDQQQVHGLLGPPTKFDEFDSKYDMLEIGARLTVCYDDSSLVKYLSIALPKQSRR